MKIRELLILITIVLFSFGSVWAVESEDAPQLLDKIREHTLPNGLKIVVVERHSAPVFYSMMSFRVGSTIEDNDLSGLSHFMEHMLFKGSQNFGTTNFKKEVPIMKELDRQALRMRDIQVALKWRFQMFEDFATSVRANLPADVRELVAENEALSWKETQKALMSKEIKFPEDWNTHQWIFEENGRQYWKEYLELIGIRAKMAELVKKQREYIVQSALDDAYKTNGGVGLNAFTGYDETAYIIGLPSNCLELWMQLESDRFLNPIFREFYPEREVVQEELRMRESSPSGKMYQNIVSTAYKAHPYGRPIIGWLSDIQITLHDDMANHYRRYYAPNNCQITMVGAVNADEVFKLAAKYFKNWKSAEVAHEVKVIEPPQEGERRTFIEFDAEPQMMIAYRIPAATHPDFYALEFMSQVLSSGRTSRFYKNIFEQGKTTSAPGSWLGPADRYPGLFMLSAVPKTPYSVEEVEKVIYDEIEKLSNELVSDWEMERVKNQYLRSNYDRLRSNRWMAFTLHSSYITFGDAKLFEEERKRFMAVTPKDIQRVANTYFTPKNRTVCTIVKPATEELSNIQNNGMEN